MGEAVIVSAIEKLGNFLLKKADLRDDEREKLRSLVVEEADLRSVVVAMAELLEDKKEMLYRLLVKVAYPLHLEEDEEEERVMNIEEKRRRREEVMWMWMKVKAEKVSSLVFEMADLWEDDDKESIYKEKLHTLLCNMMPNKTFNINAPNSLAIEIYSLAIEMAEGGKGKLCKEKLGKAKLRNERLYKWLAKMADLWDRKKLGKGKLRKEKLYSWLAKKADLWDQKKLFHSLRELTTLPHMDEEQRKFRVRMKDVLKKVEEAKNDLMIILDIINKSEDLRYFISDAVEMAQEASLLITAMDSDLFIFLLEIFNCFFIQIMSCYPGYPFTWFLEEMESILKWLQESKERMVEFGSAESQINYVGEELQLLDVVGLEEEVELMLYRISLNYPKKICICGMGGIGKTTLARVVYNHPKIVKEYECRAWVCLSSRKLSRKELLINLIRQLQFRRDDDDDVDDMLMKLEEADNRSLQQMLHQQLHCKPYFIVLDDVSDDTTLKYLHRHAIPKSTRYYGGGRLLSTTRDQDIRRNYTGDKYRMEYLDDDKSWQLLLKTALYGSSDDEKFPKQLERRGRQMLRRKCNGLPLAIKEVGRQWAEKRQSRSEWEEIVESSMDLDLSESLEALESTYLKLDPHVKSCFLSLAFFKEGTPIRTNKLLHIWAASGRQNEHMMSLNKLIKESIIEVKEMTKFHGLDGAKTYHINNVFHMLSITKVEDEIGFEILRKDGNNNRAASHEPRHRVIHRSRDDKFNFNYSSTKQDKHLLSLFFHGGGFSDIATPSYWNRFEQLKILDMEGFGLKILPETVGELTELTYLGLRNNCIQELPRSLGRLKKLEVLDIALNFMVAVPDIIWEMDMLKHLYMSDIICQKPLKIDVLRNLQTLTYISVDNWTYELSGLKKMRALRKLGIEGVDENTDVSKLFASLAKLENLTILILRGFRFRSLPSLDGLGILHNVNKLKLEGLLTRLPTANNFPPNIILVSLVNSCLDEDPMPILEKLPKLKYLHLQNAYTGQEMVISPDGFGKLNELVIEELWHLRKINVGRGHAPENLVRSEIISCPYLDTTTREKLIFNGYIPYFF